MCLSKYCTLQLLSCTKGSNYYRIGSRIVVNSSRTPSRTSKHLSQSTQYTHNTQVTQSQAT